MDEVWIDKWIAVFINATSEICLEPYRLELESCRLGQGIVWYARIPDQSG